MRRKILYCLLITTLIHSGTLLAENCTPWLAKIASVQGKAQVKRLHHEQWENAYQDESLCNGDSIRTAAHSRLVLNFFNHSIATLDQYSTLIFPPPEPSKSWFLNLIEGSAFFRSRQDQELDVHTPFVNAVHKGTEFLVSVDADKAQITVFDGEVLAQNQAGQISVKDDYVTEVRRDQIPQAHKLTVTPENAVQWTLYYPPVMDYQSQSYPNSLQPALTSYRQGDVYAAIEALTQVAQSDRDLAYFNLSAALLLTVGRVDEANAYIQHAFALKANDSTAYALQAIIAVAQNQSDKALILARKAVELNAQSDATYIALSYAYQTQLNIEDALKAAQVATTLNPNNALAWARLSELQLSVGDQKTALMCAQKAQALNPNLARIQIIQGFAELAESHTEQAAIALQKAIKQDPSDPLARLGLGLVKIRQGDLEAGKNELELAVNLDPNNAILRSYLGKSLYELKNEAFAAKEFDIAKSMDSKNPTPWFYDAILKQTNNRPVAALRDMQKAIALNGNRGVYRSSLLLDEDKAVRSANLGRIYKTLGFDDVARQQATSSLTIDPSNYGAHRLLADSYLYRPRQELARASEILQAQLLQPLNYSPVQPQLAYTDLNIPKGAGFADTSFNEYSRLFEGNQYHLSATGLYGSNDTRADEAVLSGIHNQLAYSLGQMHYQTDGFRPNADLKHNLYNAFAQYEFSPQLSVQAEYRYRETAHGDIQMPGTPSTTNDGKTLNFDPTQRRNLKQNTYRLGVKYSPTTHSDILGSFIYADRSELQHADHYSININHHQKAYQIESQYLYHQTGINTVLGGGVYQVENHSLLDIPDMHLAESYNNNHYTAYSYSNIAIAKNIVMSAGLSYDNYSDNAINISQLSPKLGWQWHINEAITLRLAGFKTVKLPIIVNQTLQPMQIAGFNQFFDDVNGTRATQYGIGLDIKPTKNFYAGLEAYKRDLDMPQENQLLKREEELYRLYFNWLPHNNWSLNSEWRFENFRGEQQDRYQTVQSAYIPLNLRFFDDRGFFADLTGQFVHQSVVPARANPEKQEGFNSNFFLLDAAIGYRFPHRYGIVSLEAKNLLDKHFKYRDRSFQILHSTNKCNR